MKHLEVSCAVRRLYRSLGFKGLRKEPVVVCSAILSQAPPVAGSSERGLLLIS